MKIKEEEYYFKAAYKTLHGAWRLTDDYFKSSQEVKEYFFKALMHDTEYVWPIEEQNGYFLVPDEIEEGRI